MDINVFSTEAAIFMKDRKKKEIADMGEDFVAYADRYAKAADMEMLEVIEQLVRLEEAGMTPDGWESLLAYLKSPDILDKSKVAKSIPDGYKACGKCGKIKKFYLFNRNSSSKQNLSGNCKECQKQAAAKSYKKTKKKRNYKKYYEENKELKREHARKYYEANKEKIDARHREYVKSKKGKAVMQKAHAKRREALANNVGIPYDRQLVIDRDKMGKEFPICNICGKPIEDISGAGLHIDHIVPVVQGGLDCFSNVACVHAKCNLTKTKDARDTTTEQVERIIERTDAYMDEHPEIFE